MIKSITHTSFAVADLDRSMAFYRDLLGFSVEMVMEVEGEKISRLVGHSGCRVRLAMLKLGGHEVELIQYLSPHGKRLAPARSDVGSAHLGFIVDNVHETYRHLASKGVQFVSEPQEFDQTRACYFTDPDGINLELIEWKS